MSRDGDGLHVDVVDRPGPPPELRDAPRRSRALGAFVATFALAAFAGAVWYAYDRGLQAGSEATAPLIQADPSPIKVRPDRPGGLEVPNQDKMVFEAMRPGEPDGRRVERLLPPPETPAEPPAPPPGSAAGASSGGGSSGTVVPIPPRTPQPATTGTDAAPPAPPTPREAASGQDSSNQTASGQTAAAPVLSPPPPVAIVPAPSDVPPARTDGGAPAASSTPATAPSSDAPPAQAPSPPTPAPAPVAESAPAPTPAPTPTPAPAQAAPQTAALPAGNFRIQLGALRDPSGAEREWNRLQRRYPDLLAGLTLRVQRVDLGADKGVFHRIQGGMLTEAAATQVCDALKARNQPCLLVRP